MSESFTGTLSSAGAVGMTDAVEVAFSSELPPERDARARRSALISGAVVVAAGVASTAVLSVLLFIRRLLLPMRAGTRLSPTRQQRSAASATA